MSDVIIHIENLSKLYRIGLRENNVQNFREVLVNCVTAPFKNFRSINKLTQVDSSFSEKEREEQGIIWTLRNISLDIKRGEVIGIIGRNGAGKSTLLKILSRITEPTSGRIEIKGRITSLLEIGTGFHPDLSGRENIFLNGAILGMKKDEIKKKFDDIVSFAELEKFIDTPVKRYSSGMYVRLAFAVAANLEPEILIIDEVLAVGDASFQKKCLGKMESVSKSGRTVLFVSHNMATIQNLCTRTILLESGKVKIDGTNEDAINEYINSMERLAEGVRLSERTDRTGGDVFRFQSVTFYNDNRTAPVSLLKSGQHISINLKYESFSDTALKDIIVAIGFFTTTGNFLFACQSDAVGKNYIIPHGKGELNCIIPKWPLSGGRYTYGVIAFFRSNIIDYVKEAGFIDIEDGDFYGTGIVPAKGHQGVFIDFKWE